MTPLCTLLSGYGVDWSPAPPVTAAKEDSPKIKTPKTKTPIEKIDSKTEIFIESINLLWNLCEASPLALKIVNDKQILPFLINHLVSYSKVFVQLILCPAIRLFNLTESQTRKNNLSIDDHFP